MSGRLTDIKMMMSLSNFALQVRLKTYQLQTLQEFWLKNCLQKQKDIIEIGEAMGQGTKRFLSLKNLN